MKAIINYDIIMINRNADVAVFDAGDVYTAGLNYELVPFMSEIYNLGKPEYYVVAVAKEEDPDTDLTYLRGTYPIVVLIVSTTYCIVCNLVW